MSLLDLDKLTVRFGGLTAVENVDCRVEKGKIFSVIGPNGAGKTTVFNAITGIYDPTTGEIRFHGRRLARPFTWRVAAGAIAVGLLTALTAALFAVNVESLWRATIKRNYTQPGEPFSYRDAWQDVGNYLRGELAIEHRRGDRWAIRTANGKQTLAFAASRKEAEATREHFSKLVAAGDAANRGTDPIVQEGDQWAIRLGAESLDHFNSEADARAALARYEAIAKEPGTLRRRALLAALFGMLAGSAGMLAVWSRARRSPEVISRAGIARTFQNIRLFQNMTVLDNVLVAMDRRLKGGVIRMALQTPGIRHQEQGARQQAIELLKFVNLDGKRSTLAKNLPYGDQRRLEIARALATEPELILLDEPAAGMNPAESIELNRLIERIRGLGLTVLLIEHHMSVVMGISDRIAVLEYGRKIAEGSPEEVRANPQVIAAYLGSEEVT